jgi:hypothetical protein
MALILGIALMVLSQINGVNMIILYSPTLFVEAGVTDSPEAILNSVYVTTWITLCTVVAFWLTHRFGHRPILIFGTLGMAFGHVLMFLQYAYPPPPAMTILAMLVPTGAFTLTLAPLSWVILSEMFPNRVRGKAMSLATLAIFTASHRRERLPDDPGRSKPPSAPAAFLICGHLLACRFFVAGDSETRTSRSRNRPLAALDQHRRAIAGAVILRL